MCRLQDSITRVIRTFKQSLHWLILEFCGGKQYNITESVYYYNDPTEDDKEDEGDEEYSDEEETLPSPLSQGWS